MDTGDSSCQQERDDDAEKVAVGDVSVVMFHNPNFFILL